MALVAAGGYALATILMKLMAEATSPLLIAGVAAILAVTVTAEVLLLRQVDLGLAYIAVIATETILVLGFAFVIGEPLTAREMAGGALVITGAAMVAF
jgi:drug/metabolite transporter (DMT)-like permease